MLFFIPLFGALAGAAIGATVKAMDGTGITKKDVERIREEVTPGTSALFLVTENADFDRLGERLHGMNSSSSAPTSPTKSARSWSTPSEADLRVRRSHPCGMRPEPAAERDWYSTNPRREERQ